jgi:hypothetical protein
MQDTTRRTTIKENKFFSENIFYEKYNHTYLVSHMNLTNVNESNLTSWLYITSILLVLIDLDLYSVWRSITYTTEPRYHHKSWLVVCLRSELPPFFYYLTRLTLKTEVNYWHETPVAPARGSSLLGASNAASKYDVVSLKLSSFFTPIHKRIIFITPLFSAVQCSAVQCRWVCVCVCVWERERERCGAPGHLSS